MIASLRQYGILEGRGDEVRLSEDAITVFADEEINSKDRTEALKRLLSNPKVFQEVSEEFPRLPSKPNLKAYMTKRKFSPTAAGKFADVYRESVEFVESQLSEYNEHNESNEEEIAMDQQVTDTDSRGTNPNWAGVPSASVTEVENIRVSKNCAIRLLADGPWGKREMQALADRIKDAVDAGIYDDLDESSSSDDWGIEAKAIAALELLAN